MKFRFKKKVGEIEFEFEQEVSTHTEFFDSVEFFSSLPATGPNGETDLRFAHRTPQGYDYFEIVSEKAGQRFCFGEHKNSKGSLFPKTWEPIFQGNDGGDYHNQPDPPTQRESRPAQPAQRQAQATTSNQEIDRAITGHFKRLGISNPGQEKGAVMKALNSRVGQLVVELALTEKKDLLAWLEQQEIGRAA